MKYYKRDPSGCWISNDGVGWQSISSFAGDYIEKTIKNVEEGYAQSKTARLHIQPLLRGWCNKQIYKLCRWLDPFKEDKPGEFK